MIATAREEWRVCPEFDGYYEVSSIGRVRRVHPTPASRCGRLLSDRSITPLGYRVVAPRTPRHNKNRTWFVHGLVASAFFGPKPLGMDVNHKNGNKLDNRVENLEYVTRAENIRHAKALGLMDESYRKRRVLAAIQKLTDEQVAELRRRRAAGERLVDLARDYGITSHHAWMLAKNRQRVAATTDELAAQRASLATAEKHHARGGGKE